MRAEIWCHETKRENGEYTLSRAYLSEDDAEASLRLRKGRFRGEENRIAIYELKKTINPPRA